MCRACRFGFRTGCARGHHRYATGNRHERDIAMSSSRSRLEVIRANDRVTTNKRSLRLCIQTCVLVLAAFGVTSPSLARSSFDGAWSVVVVTRAGACTPTLRPCHRPSHCRCLWLSRHGAWCSKKTRPGPVALNPHPAQLRRHSRQLDDPLAAFDHAKPGEAVVVDPAAAEDSGRPAAQQGAQGGPSRGRLVRAR